MRFAPLLCLAILIGAAAPLRAHPVPKSSHDRTIKVHLEKSAKPGHLSIRIDYRLEVDETTVLLEDMLPFKDEVDFTRYRGKPLEYYAEYMRIYAPILADRMIVKLNGEAVELSCAANERVPRLVDEQGQALGHLRCKFVFRGEAPLAADQESTFWVRECNFQLQEGQILLGFVNAADLTTRRLIAPDEALQKRPPTQQKPSDDEKLRYLKVVFVPGPETFTPPPAATTSPLVQPTDADQQASALFNEGDSLLWLVTGDYALWMQLMLATLFGAAHALTPGHGKTLVAAYLIGQRGTVWHALVLGIVTTVTHTGALLILGAILYFLPAHLQTEFKQWLIQGVGLAVGLMIVCLGVWLLLQRLSGRADHIHLGAGHHHDHGHDHTHSHEHGHSHSHGVDWTAGGATGVRWWGLIVLGVTGGMIPCVDAIGLIAFFVARGEFWIVLPALVCFSAGLAGVLVLIGILVVQMPRFTKSRLGEGRFVRALPIVSSVVIVAMGFWLCYKGVN